MSARITVYGIPNCDQIKKTRAWFTARGVTIDFYDYKRTPPTRAMLESWSRQVDWTRLLNRQGTTWRKLAPAVQAGIQDAQSAIALMVEQPSLIRRPVVVVGTTVHVGYDADAFERLAA